jgi:hypothetical protein
LKTSNRARPNNKNTTINGDHKWGGWGCIYNTAHSNLPGKTKHNKQRVHRTEQPPPARFSLNRQKEKVKEEKKRRDNKNGKH